MTQHVRARVVTFGVEQPADVHVGRGFVWQRTSEGDIPLLPLAAVHLQGRHMLSNVAAATAISHLAGASGASLARALEGFHGLEHVMELVATRGGVRFVNDSKATNVDAAAKSIESFDKVVAIIGGKFKGGDFADLAEPLRAHGRAVVAIGEARPLVRAALEEGGAGGRSGFARRSGAARVGPRGARRRGAAGAGVLELRHVRRLRGARTQVQGGGAEADHRSVTCRAVSSRQPVGGNWELVAGSAGCPGLRGWCPNSPID